ncbi:hypothetical protein [Robinsoniella sp. KNHs210]|uniref:hypothetical protein n=1 Tax=Robinsoniella sp. KNHs210 TaxID=1469950 RepID=UPI000485A058|nr:hypothetical protein [Robinsoniella sp. KNHs210]
MNIKQKIDFMISSLEVAKGEIEYSEEYKRKLLSVQEGGSPEWEFYQINRNPNITLARENLKTVSRYSSIVAKELPEIFGEETVV